MEQQTPEMIFILTEISSKDCLFKLSLNMLRPMNVEKTHNRVVLISFILRL